MEIHWPELGSLGGLAWKKNTMVGSSKSFGPVGDQELAGDWVGASLKNDRGPAESVAEVTHMPFGVVVGNGYYDEHTQVCRPNLVQGNTHIGFRN